MESGAKRALTAQEISGRVITAAMRVHTAVGPGLLESAYEACLLHELQEGGLRVRSQVPFPLVYRGLKLDVGYRIDLIVEDCVIVEIKCVEAIAPVHKAQLLSYLRLTDRPLGLIINFHVEHLKEGIRRVVNGFNWK
ncbi:MAG TPA: GxxExxY protein [Terriglobales bacterium]|nr:GxxExxY protein [Terriglobales bacterium]